MRAPDSPRTSGVRGLRVTWTLFIPLSGMKRAHGHSGSTVVPDGYAWRGGSSPGSLNSGGGSGSFGGGSGVSSSWPSSVAGGSDGIGSVASSGVERLCRTPVGASLAPTRPLPRDDRRSRSVDSSHSTASGPRWCRSGAGPGRSSGGRLRRSAAPAMNSRAAQARARKVWPTGRSGRRTTIRSADHAPAAAITDPSPNGMWNSAPSARLRSSTSIAAAVRIVAASTNENGPNVLTIKRSAATPATRCSKFSRRHVSTTPSAARRGSSERLASAIAGVGVVPVLDLVLSRLPAEIYLAAVAERREVDQPALEVAQDHLHRLQLAERALQLEEGLRNHAARRAASIRGRGLAQRCSGILVGELLARGAQPLEPLDHPLEGRVGLLDRVVPGMLGHDSRSVSSPRDALSPAPRAGRRHRGRHSGGDQRQQ